VFTKSWYTLEASQKKRAKEKANARRLRKSQWWQLKINEGACYYCGKSFRPQELTMDHIVPIARGGKSSRGNVVPACKACNTNKKLEIPVEKLLKTLQVKD